MVELLDQIRAMLAQESGAYRTMDYLSPSVQQSLSFRSLEDLIPVGESSTVSSDSSSGITELWREKICEWSYQVIDHFDFSREVVAIAMNYLDRYLATKTVNKKVFQLAAMTALFLAVKLHEPSKLSMASMIELSRGCFNVEQMAAMEISLIRGVGWHLHPPTAHSFTKRFLHMIPLTTISVDVLYDVLELSRFLTELSVIDYFFVAHQPSNIALAAIANAMQDIAAVSPEAQQEFVDLLQRNNDIDLEGSHSILECRARLRLLCALQGSLVAPPSGVEANPRGEGLSPVCVSYGTPQYQASSQKHNAYYQAAPTPATAETASRLT